MTAVGLIYLAISILLPWLCGTSLVVLATRRTQALNGWYLWGHGYLVGIVAVTLLIKLFFTAGIPIGLHTVGPLLLLPLAILFHSAF